jgi:phage terminase large subunit GpA-like protein
MKSYEFLFKDGVNLAGEGEGEALALHNAYLRNGYLPIVELVKTTLVSDSAIPFLHDPPELITAGVDVQKDRLVAEVFMRGKGRKG